MRALVCWGNRTSDGYVLDGHVHRKFELVYDARDKMWKGLLGPHWVAGATPCEVVKEVLGNIEATFEVLAAHYVGGAAALLENREVVVSLLFFVGDVVRAHDEHHAACTRFEADKARGALQ